MEAFGIHRETLATLARSAPAGAGLDDALGARIGGLAL
jgi:hypothetical protein